nr:Ketobutyrate formate-lyase [Klebsiella pneumoniae]
MIKSAFEAYGREMDPDFEYQFTALRKTHNQGVLTSIPRICCAAANPGC